MKITKQCDEIVIRIPYWSKRFNPYMVKENGEPEDVGEFQTLTGLIVRHRERGNDYDEIGLAWTIDMDYKNKQDQIGDFAIMYDGDEEEFKKLCEELNLRVDEITLD